MPEGMDLAEEHRAESVRMKVCVKKCGKVDVLGMTSCEQLEKHVYVPLMRSATGEA